MNVWSYHRHRCSRASDECFLATIGAIHICLAEVHHTSRFHHAPYRAQARAPSLGEVRDLDFGRNGVLIGSDERKAGKARCDVRNRRCNAPMDESELLLMLRLQVDYGFDIARLNYRKAATEVFHEQLTCEVILNAGAEVGVLELVFHAANLPLVTRTLGPATMCHAHSDI